MLGRYVEIVRWDNKMKKGFLHKILFLTASLLSVYNNTNCCVYKSAQHIFSDPKKGVNYDNIISEKAIFILFFVVFDRNICLHFLAGHLE